MHKTRFILWLALACALALLPLASSAAAAKEARAARYDVDLAVQADGSVLVTETVVFVYTGGPFTFVTRDIPAERTDGLYSPIGRLPDVYAINITDGGFPSGSEVTVGTDTYVVFPTFAVRKAA